MARVDSMASAKKPAEPSKAGLDQRAKIKIAIAAIALLAATVLIISYTGVFSTPYESPDQAEQILTPEEQKEFEKIRDLPPPDPDAPFDPQNPPPAGS